MMTDEELEIANGLIIENVQLRAEVEGLKAELARLLIENEQSKVQLIRIMGVAHRERP